jgi:hypothetical protein
VGFSKTSREQRDQYLSGTYKKPTNSDIVEGTLMMITKKQNEASMSCFTMVLVKEQVMGLVSWIITKVCLGGLHGPRIKE